jgi:hypothetical protein
MNTADALRRAMQAVKDADIPEDLWPIALPLALADLRDNSAAVDSSTRNDSAARAPKQSQHSGGIPKKPVKRPPRPAAPFSKAGVGSQTGIFETVAAAPEFLERVSKQTGVDIGDIKDVFHIESGALQLKVLGKDLGATDKPKTKTVTALMAGAVFAGSDIPSIPYSESCDASARNMRPSTCVKQQVSARWARERRRR